MSFDSFLATINAPQITLTSAVFKLILSLIAGGLVGLNRERHNQPAGFRTHIIICLGGCLLMMLSIYVPQEYFNLKNGDPGRIAAQVVSGIGFLGAGAIIRLGTNVRGITTASSIWLISAVGLTIGAGLYIISLVTVVLALFTLIILEKVEHLFFPQTLLKTIVLSFSEERYMGNEIKDILSKGKISISDYSVEMHNNQVKTSELTLIVKIPETTNLSPIIAELRDLPHLETLKIN